MWSLYPPCRRVPSGFGDTQSTSRSSWQARHSAAADPRKDDALVTDGYAGRIGAQCDGFADDLVAHGEGEFHAAAFDGGSFAVAEIEIAVPDVYVGMAYAACRHLHQDFRTLRFRVGVFGAFQGVLPHSTIWQLRIVATLDTPSSLIGAGIVQICRRGVTTGSGEVTCQSRKRGTPP